MAKDPLSATALLVSAVLCALAPPGPALAVDTSKWACSRCPFPESASVRTAAGISHVSTADARFGNANGYDRDGAYADIDLFATGTANEQRWRVALQGLALDARAVDVQWRAPRWSVGLSHRDLPYRLYGDTRSVFRRVGDDRLALPPTWQRAALTDGLQVEEALRKTPIERRRRENRLAFSMSIAPRTAAEIEWQRQQVSGTERVGAAFFSQAAIVARPLEMRTDTARVGLSWQGSRANFTIAARGSAFHNEPLGLTWENPFLGVPQGGRGQLAASPDNRFLAVDANGGWRLGPAVVRFRHSSGRITQNDALLPYSLNPQLAAPLPKASLDGRVLTGRSLIEMSMPVLTSGRIKAGYRSYRRDNATDAARWERVITDSFSSGDSARDRIYSLDREFIWIRGDWRFSKALRLTAGAERGVTTRDLQELERQTSRRGWLRLDLSPSAVVQLGLKAGREKRKGQDYDVAFAGTLGENPLLRRWHLAYRFSDYVELSGHFSPHRWPLVLSTTFRTEDEDYNRTPLGVESAKSDSLQMELSWQLGAASSLFLTGGLEERRLIQSGSTSFSAPTFRALDVDEFRHAVIGGRFGWPESGVDLSLSAGYFADRVDVRIAPVGESANNFPAIRSRRARFDLQLDFPLGVQWGAYFNLRFEDMRQDDWARSASVTPHPVLLSLGAEPYDYDGLRFGFGIKRHFAAAGR